MNDAVGLPLSVGCVVSFITPQIILSFGIVSEIDEVTNSIKIDNYVNGVKHTMIMPTPTSKVFITDPFKLQVSTNPDHVKLFQDLQSWVLKQYTWIDQYRTQFVAYAKSVEEARAYMLEWAPERAELYTQDPQESKIPLGYIFQDPYRFFHSQS